MVFRAKNCQPYTFNFHGQIRIGTGHVFQPAWTMTSSTSALYGPTYVGSVSGICAFQILNKFITQFPGGWFQNWLHEICLYPSGPSQPNISPFGLIWALKVPFLCFSHKINLAPWWPITKLAPWTLRIPFRTNSAKYQPIWTLILSMHWLRFQCRTE